MSLIVSNVTYKPFKYPWAIALAEEHEKIHWTEVDAKLEEDVKDWQSNLSDSEKNLLHQILKLFTQADVNVASTYSDMFIPYFKNNEIRSMLLSFAAREGIHQRAYALLNDTLGLPETDYNAFLDYEEMVDKHKFMLDMSMDTPHKVGLSLSKTVFSEGVSLFGSFGMLINFQRTGKMKGMGEIVAWSQLDEAVTPDTMLLLKNGKY
jgi:ribonucleotide reductase beta subunit family protein with ferritin-like domain